LNIPIIIIIIIIIRIYMHNEFIKRYKIHTV